MQFLALVTVAVVNTIWRGFALSVLWLWFVVPMFAAPLLSIPYAIGLSTIAAFLTANGITNQEDKREFAEKLIRAFVAGLLWPLFALGVGWAAHQFA